jgi:phosphonate transport system substrate-binding protein
MSRRPLRVATFLAPNMLGVHAFIVRYLADRLDQPAELFVGSDYGQLTEETDAAFVCGLAYIELARDGAAPVEPVAAPVLQGDRYHSQPVYFSDVIVRRDSPFSCFADLRGRSWSYNEPFSHSGYGVTRYRLVQLGETSGFFGSVVEAGWHERSIRLVCSGEIDASAIDSHVLALTLRDRPDLIGQLRIIDSLGPSTVQPVVVARRLPDRLKGAIQAVLLELGEDPVARPHLDRGLVERFVPVTDDSYNDLRVMRDACQRADFMTLR